jgi:hypothetical protein
MLAEMLKTESQFGTVGVEVGVTTGLLILRELRMEYQAKSHPLSMIQIGQQESL